MKIINTMWFTPWGSYDIIGIVIGLDEQTGEKKAYIGFGNRLNQELDAKHIAKTGAKLTKETLAELTKWLED